jgi:hypothetical protein
LYTFTDPIVGSCKTASPEVKQLYLGLFWTRFEVTNGKIKNAIPSELVGHLIALGGLSVGKDRPMPKNSVFSQGSGYLKEGVRIKSFRGA